MSRCTLFLVLAGMVALCMSTATPTWEPPAAEPQDFVDEDVEELARNVFAAKLRGCVRKVDMNKLKEDEKDLLTVGCIRPALRGWPKTAKAIANRYVKCVGSKGVSEAAKDAAKQVANCMTAAPTTAWELPAAEPRDLDVFLDELVDNDGEELALIGFAAKLTGCIRKVDRSKLNKDDKKALVMCIRPALRGSPQTAQAIADRFVKCVASKSVSDAAKDAAKQVASCMTSAPTPAWELPAAEPQDFEDEDAEELALNRFAAKLKGCVQKVDSSKLKEDEKKVLQACIRPALRGCPRTAQVVAEKYAKCVASKNVSVAAKDAAKQVASCMTSA